VISGIDLYAIVATYLVVKEYILCYNCFWIKPKDEK
jgi:hypothetical protein